MTKQIKTIKAPKLIEGAANLSKEFGLIKAAGAKLDQRIQVAALSVIMHVEKCGDVTVATGLMDAMPQGSRKAALIEWFLAHGKMRQNVDAAGKVNKDLPWLFDKTKETKFELGMENPWYTFKPEKLDEEAFDFQGLLASLLKRAEKAAAGGKEVKGADLLARIKLASEGVSGAAGTEA